MARLAGSAGLVFVHRRRDRRRARAAGDAHLGFVGAALFLGMLAPRVASRPAVAAAVTGGLVAAGAGIVRPELGIVCALAGVAAGTAVRR